MHRFDKTTARPLKEPAISTAALLLREPPPPGRTPEQLLRHFEIEKSIADRLKRADRAGRARIYATMYDELFSLVPDHPRLTRRRDPRRLAEINAQKLALLKRFLSPAKTVVEFGCGDASFAYELCGRVARVYGVDISDQRDPMLPLPKNFEMVVYDGFDLPLPDGCADVAFSDQLIEHLHPDDVRLHFETVRRILKPGGTYVLRTPHRFSGPHDVSRYFCDNPQGFHLKEWTYRELVQVLRNTGFDQIKPLSEKWMRNLVMRFATPTHLEQVCDRASNRHAASIAKTLLRDLTLFAVTDSAKASHPLDLRAKSSGRKADCESGPRSRNPSSRAVACGPRSTPA